MKKALIAVCVLLVTVAAVLFLTLSNFGPLVKKIVNTMGPQVTQTDVLVADVGVSIFSGEAKIQDFLLGNPKGFNSSYAMKVGSVYVDIDEGSITKNPIVINKIEIIAPQIMYEKISGSDNFQQLLKNIQGSEKSERKTNQNSSPSGEQAGKKIVINNVIVKDGNVKLNISTLGGKEVMAVLPDIHLKDIGKAKQGVTPAEAFSQIFAALYKNISSDSVTQAFNEGIRQIGRLKNLDSAKLKTGTDTAKSAANSAVKNIESTTKGLIGLFNKN